MIGKRIPTTITTLALALALTLALTLAMIPGLIPTATAADAAGNGDRIKELQLALGRSLDTYLVDERRSSLEISILVTTIKGDVLYELKPQVLRIPASTVKIVSSGISLIELGAERRLQTPIRSEGHSDGEGVLQGDLYLVGRGDPTLTSAHLEEAARRLREAGVTGVAGDLVYDVSFLDEEKPRFGSNARHLYSPPCALTVNYSWIVLELDDGPPPRLSTIPRTAYARLEYDIRVSSSSRPGKPPMILHEEPWGDRYTINGTVTAWDKRYKYLRLCVSRPGLYAATLFKEALAEAGIQIHGGLRQGQVPAAARDLHVITGEPLIEAIRELNQESNNVVAEVINKDLGAYSDTPPGTREKGLRVLRRYCRNKIGLGQDDGFTLADASGLSTANRLSAAQLNRVLAHLYERSGMAFVETLARQGRHPHAMNPIPPSHIRLYVKSGTLPVTGVNAVAGYIFLDRTDEVLSYVVLTRRRSQGPPAYSGTYTNPITAAIVDALAEVSS